MSNHWSHTITTEDINAVEVFEFSFNDPAALRLEIIEMLAEEAEDHEIIELLAEEAENQRLMLCDDEWGCK
jgi:hypothetical protein